MPNSNFQSIRLLDLDCFYKGKQCRSRSVGFFRSQLIWIYSVVCKGRVYPASAGQGLTLCVLSNFECFFVFCGFYFLLFQKNLSRISSECQTVWIQIRPDLLLHLIWVLFVCVEVLRPSQPNGVMSSAVSLPNHTFTGQA